MNETASFSQLNLLNLYFNRVSNGESCLMVTGQTPSGRPLMVASGLDLSKIGDVPLVPGCDELRGRSYKVDCLISVKLSVAALWPLSACGVHASPIRPPVTLMEPLWGILDWGRPCPNAK